MPAENLRIVNDPVNPTVEMCTTWVGEKVECGDIAESSGRLGITAIKALAAMRTDNEPQTVQSLRDDLDTLVSRWMRKNPGAKEETARSYATRARAMLDIYLEWYPDPTAFRFKEARVRRPKTEGERSNSPKGTKTTAAAPAPAASPPVPPVQTYSHRLKVGPDRFVAFDIPDGFTVAEWKRLVAHTLTLCEDFDPEHAPQVPGFGMSRT